MRRDDATTLNEFGNLHFRRFLSSSEADRNRGLLAPRGARQARDDAHHGILPRTLEVNSQKQYSDAAGHRKNFPLVCFRISPHVMICFNGTCLDLGPLESMTVGFIPIEFC